MPEPTPAAIDWRAHVRQRLPPLAISPEREAEIVDELALQLEAAHDAARAAGLSEEQARARAEAEVPDWQALAATLVRIERPATPAPALGAGGGGGLLSGFGGDLRYALRALRRAPAFTAVAVGTLALGIGATTIVYSLVDGILLRPLPIAEPERVVLARETGPDGGEFSASWPNFVDWRERARSFSGLAAWRGVPLNLTGGERPRRILGRQVTANLFDVLGVRPHLGRGLLPTDDQPGVEAVCLVSFGFWRRELDGDPGAIGRRLTLDDLPVTVVGVLPRDFSIARQEDVFLPLGLALRPGSFLLARGNHNGLAAIGRLAPGATVESARAEIETIGAQLAQQYPDTNSGNGATAGPLYEVLVGDARPMLRVLLAAVGAMLLIACVNLASLLIARGAGRAQELAVRRALGAARWRIARQQLTESLILALAGGAAGVALARAGFAAVLALLPPGQARAHLVALDLRVLAAMAAVSVVTGLVFGTVPALQAAGGRSPSLLRGSRLTPATGRAATRRRLLVAEVALALMLLAAAGLALRTLANLQAIDPGFEPGGAIAAQVSLPATRYTHERRRAFVAAAVERVAALPGVDAAAFAGSLPVEGANWYSVFIVGDQPVPPRAELPSAAFTPATPGYFDALEIRLVRGRLFAPGDGPEAPTVAVVNESLARRFWPAGDALGQRLKQGWPEDQEPWREIVGVVADVKTDGVDQPTPLQAYLPYSQVPTGYGVIVARTGGDPGRLARPLEAAIHEVDPDLPVFDVRTLDQVLDRGVGTQRLTVALLSGFAFLALAMAAVGVFGVAGYSVAQRTRELGVRVALGADPGRVLRLVLGQELRVCAAGIALGAAGALALAGVMRSLLYGVPPRDPATLAAAATLLFAVTALACYLPARRAARVDPIEALRQE
jgi:putative ABC transport system permease protein